MRSWVDTLNEASENRIELVQRLFGEELDHLKLDIANFISLDPSPNHKNLRWLVQTYLRHPYDLHDEKIFARLSMPNIGDIFAYETMEDLFLATDKYAARAQRTMDLNAVTIDDVDLPEGWEKISVNDAHELNELLDHTGGVRGKDALLQYGEAFYSYHGLLIAAVTHSGHAFSRMLDWNGKHGSRPREYIPAVAALAEALHAHYLPGDDY